MIISKASPKEYDSIRLFYHSLIDALEGTRYHPKWQKDIYPAPEDLRGAVLAGELYIGRVDSRMAAAMVLNQKCNPEYADAAWRTFLNPSEFMVIHMLGVHRDFAGQGLAKEMVRFAIEKAKAWGMKAIRLDVLKGNAPAERLYPAMGFVYVDTIQLFYEDTGRADFGLYELVLPAKPADTDYGDKTEVLV
ncbi:MAG: GNAT family N-acetyltransferase [Blautia sp.]|nr:GNAT family N-acetyltransferase [Blautia sp.]